MELAALVWGLAKLAEIVGTGALTKVGENLLDAASPRVKELYGALVNKMPESFTARAIEAGQELDYDRLITDVKSIEQDPEVIKLADEIRSLIAQNKKLKDKLDAEVAKIGVKNTYINKGKSSPVFNGSVRTVTINYGKEPD